MSKSKVKVKFKPNRKGITQYQKQISEHPEQVITEIECPECKTRVQLRNGMGVCPNCNQLIFPKKNDTQQDILCH